MLAGQFLFGVHQSGKSGGTPRTPKLSGVWVVHLGRPIAAERLYSGGTRTIIRAIACLACIVQVASIVIDTPFSKDKLQGNWQRADNNATKGDRRFATQQIS
jgi:hypothetical protein